MVRFIDEEAFEAVKCCVKYRDDINFEDLEKELLILFFDESLRPHSPPPPAKQRDVVKKLLANTNKQISHLEKLYGHPYENAHGAEMLHMEIPQYLKEVVENIESNQEALINLVDQFPNKMESGRPREDYTLKLVDKIAAIFVEYTDLPVKTNPDMDANTPPPFQVFVEQCYEALRYEISDGFEANLHRYVGHLRGHGKIPRH